MNLTDPMIKAAKPKDKPYKLADGAGLLLEVRPTGAKWWRFRYYRPNGKENTISLGVYPKITLKAARAKRDAARALLDQGIDPSENRKDEKRQATIAAANSFESIARKWFEHWRGAKVEGHVKQIEAML